MVTLCGLEGNCTSGTALAMCYAETSVVYPLTVSRTRNGKWAPHLSLCMQYGIVYLLPLPALNLWILSGYLLCAISSCVPSSFYLQYFTTFDPNSTIFTFHTLNYCTLLP